ncbi:hypothetical protein [Streptomyces sp. NPDC088350]|uniref:hypothetical protein n=1 Tax=Streptomyces sp. NPDC088350 TaxID=3365854 RepID=UPI00382EEDAC
MKSLDVIVHAISLASATSHSYELRAATGEALPSFEAGAHIDVRLGPSLIRQYSLCNSPEDSDRYHVVSGVLREEGVAVFRAYGERTDAVVYNARGAMATS